MANTIYNLRDYGYNLERRLDYMHEDGIKVIIDASSLPQGSCKCCCGKCNNKEVDEVTPTEETHKTEDTSTPSPDNGLGGVVDDLKDGEQCPSDTCLPKGEGETTEVKYSDLNDEINGTCANNTCIKP